MLNSLLKRALGLERTVVEGVRIEGDSIIVSVRPRRAAPRCPVCGRRCAAYDRLRPRRWRAPDLGSTRCHLEYAPVRARCPEHGVRAAPVPWARCASSRFTSAFEDWVAWLALHMCRSALSELARVDWHTVGGICARVEASLEAADGRGRLDGLRRIGVDETSYRKGQRYMTVVVDHDRGRVVWACRGHGKARLNEFLDLLTDEQREAIEVVTADGASWIADAVAERLPRAELAVDPFHAVSWATEALDALRRETWRGLRSAPRRRGEPDPASAVKGLRFPLLKNPEDLSGRQASALDALRRTGSALWRGYLLKEGLRAVFRAGPGEAADALDGWLAWACRSRIPRFVELSRKVRRKRRGILRSIELGVSNARAEAVNNKIKVAIRQGYGFRNIDNLIALIMLRCSDLRPVLPGREA